MEKRKLGWCFICERYDIPQEQMNPRHNRCKPCERDYVEFRRAFKVEHGRWPTMEEFKSDSD